MDGESFPTCPELFEVATCLLELVEEYLALGLGKGWVDTGIAGLISLVMGAG
jgi:hypothetical protein